MQSSILLMDPIKFNPRWKEELVAFSGEGVLILEIAMGCTNWCMENRIPISAVNNTFYVRRKNSYLIWKRSKAKDFFSGH